MRTLIDGVTKHKVALIIIFVFYVVLFIKAGSKSYWLDELFSVYMRGIAHESFREHFNFIRIANPVIPLYEVTLYAWMRVFGDTELATRSLSILFVSISAIFLYLFTLRIFNKRTATTSVLLFLFSNLIVMYALEARYYGQMLFLTTLSSYILLLYSESFCINFSWKNIFINGYFPVLTLVNMALMLNHTFNYLFLAVQALFLTFFMLTLKTTDRWYVKIVKVLLVYLTPLLLIALLWPPTIKYIFNPELLSYMHNVIKSVLHTATPGISLTEIVIISLVLISVVLALRKIIPRFVNVHRKNKLVQYFLNAYNRRQVLPIFLIIPLVVIFFMDFRTLGIMSQEGLHNPSQIFLNNLVYFTLSPPKFADILLLFFMLFVVIR
nr:glycosyltransferase family 39 protein [Bacteroidota bacterium]